MTDPRRTEERTHVSERDPVKVPDWFLEAMAWEDREARRKQHLISVAMACGAIGITIGFLLALAWCVK
jgi:hypothetical protein